MVNYAGTLEKLRHNTKLNVKSEIDMHGVSERMENLEDLLHIKPNNVQSVFERLKNIENRLLHLEASSPEYRHFIVCFYNSYDLRF